MFRGGWVLILPVLFMFDQTLPAPWCSSPQRYDVHRFPPRCLDCPKITLNPMRLSRVSTQMRQRVVKFSPGLPHNQTCGCWKAGNAVIDISLNASWVVSGLAFQVNRNQWLKRFSVEASGDNQTFLDWGVYTQVNFSASSAVFFRYPIRATYFRLTVLEYVNHMINSSTGYPLLINALVSETEPFGCECAALATGECCPSPNMEVKNNSCVVCMDPTDLHTVMIDGCGRCKSGTVAHGLKCVPVVPVNKIQSLEIYDQTGTGGDGWSANVELDYGNSSIILFLSSGSENMPCAPPFSSRECFASFSSGNFTPVLWNVDLFNQSTETVARSGLEINRQYLQFDRGRLTLDMTEATIRSWAECDQSQCIGVFGALFIGVGDGQAFSVNVIQRSLVFALTIPKALVCSFSKWFVPTTVEIHHLVDRDQFILLLTPPTATPPWVQWDDSLDKVAVEVDGTMSHPPPPKWHSLRIFAGDRQLLVAEPIRIVKINTPPLDLQIVKESTWVKIVYGLGLNETPGPGDSEQLATISAMSIHPMRLVRLVSVVGGITAVYTTSKGFISNSKRALDLVVACNGMMDKPSMVRWLEAALGLIDSDTEWFVEQACDRVRMGTVSKLYWLVPIMNAGRNDKAEMQVEAVFA